jgi:hypothetical protein
MRVPTPQRPPWRGSVGSMVKIGSSSLDVSRSASAPTSLDGRPERRVRRARRVRMGRTSGHRRLTGAGLRGASRPSSANGSPRWTAGRRRHRDEGGLAASRPGLSAANIAAAARIAATLRPTIDLLRTRTFSPPGGDLAALRRAGPGEQGARDQGVTRRREAAPCLSARRASPLRCSPHCNLLERVRDRSRGARRTRPGLPALLRAGAGFLTGKYRPAPAVDSPRAGARALPRARRLRAGRVDESRPPTACRWPRSRWRGSPQPTVAAPWRARARSTSCAPAAVLELELSASGWRAVAAGGW